MIGRTLAHYEILEKIGAGGMGEVYRARDTRLGREVAVKVLPAVYSADPDRLRRFELEARAAGMLNHPNILTIYDIGTADGSPFVVSELLEGETLRERISGTALAPRRAIDYALQTANGLAAAHDKGIVHRDLKPENLFLTKDGRIKILDFGLAKLTQPEIAAGAGSNAPTVADATEPGRILGTAGYMSPEQVRGRPTDHRSDLFTLGAILYEMLSGRRAFRGESAVEVMNAILKEDPPDLSESNPSTPPALERIVHHCLEKNPEQRFQSARDVAFNLEALSGTSTASGASAALGPVARREPVRRVLVAAVAVALLAATFFAGRRLGFIAAESSHAPPSFTRLTFRRGIIASARFAPDGQTVVYSAAWDGRPLELFSARLDFPESRSLALTDVRIAAVSPSGEMALVLSPQATPFNSAGVLARAPLAGGSPRKVLEGVAEADWSPDGSQLAVVRFTSGKVRLEFPIGKVLYETAGSISFPRISARGDRVAFFDHPLRNDDRGSVAVVDLAGRKTTLSSGWASVHGLAWSRQNPGEIWFTASSAGIGRNLYGVNLDGRQRAILRVPGGIILQDVSREGRVLMVRDEQRFSIAGMAPGETQERDLTWFGRSIAMDLSPDGKTLLFREEGDPVGPNYAVCIRKTDGSPPVRLGEGMPLALSPDGNWVLAAHPTQPGLFLLPTGAGDVRKLKTDPVQTAQQGSWFPDSRRIAFYGSEPGKPRRCFTFDIDGSQPPRPVTPEGTSVCAVSPDGKWIGAATRGPTLALAAYPVEGGEPQRLSSLLPGEFAAGWGSDSRSIYVFRGDQGVTKIFRVPLATGRREPWKEITAPDPAGLTRFALMKVASDGKSYVRSYGRILSDLYLVQGLQ